MVVMRAGAISVPLQPFSTATLSNPAEQTRSVGRPTQEDMQ